MFDTILLLLVLVLFTASPSRVLFFVESFPNHVIVSSKQRKIGPTLPPRRTGGAFPSCSLFGRSRTSSTEQERDGNFWYSSQQQINNKNNNHNHNHNHNHNRNKKRSSSLSSSSSSFNVHVPTLDADGPLPPACYISASAAAASASDRDDSYYKKDTCCIQVALNVADCIQQVQSSSDNEYAKQFIHELHSYVQAGMTTFQLQTTPSSSSNNNQIIDWALEHLYAPWMQDTPQSVLDQCHLTIPFIPLDDNQQQQHRIQYSRNQKYNQDSNNKNERNNLVLFTKTDIRRRVLDLLSRMGNKNDAIDDLQLHYQLLFQDKKETSYYYMDILETLQDLQREGYIRSISACHFPIALQQQIQTTIPIVDSFQQDENLLLSLRQSSLHEEDDDDNTSRLPLTYWSSPLAGGWLTDRFIDDNWMHSSTSTRTTTSKVGRKHIKSKPNPHIWSNLLSETELYHWKHTIPAWAKRYQAQHAQHVKLKLKEPQSSTSSSSSLWTLYQSQVVATLHDIAQRHGVSMASVALRWTLQQQKQQSSSSSSSSSSNTSTADSCVVACRLGSSSSSSTSSFGKKHRSQELRQVMTFQLESDDMERLNEVSARTSTKQQQEQEDDDDPSFLLLDEDEFLRDIRLLQNENNGLFLPPKAYK